MAPGQALDPRQALMEAIKLRSFTLRKVDSCAGGMPMLAALCMLLLTGAD